MTNHPKLTPERLARRAIVYVRQSKPMQVVHNLESQRLQYRLAERARELGFAQVMTIDEDLGRTACGLVERPGFEHLVGEVCSGEVSAVFCIEASRLARNGREWHHLIELCGMVGAVVVDLDGIYDPNLINDRLWLGLKGQMSAAIPDVHEGATLSRLLRNVRLRQLVLFRPPVSETCFSPG
jgi:hypothetical protein